MRNNKGFMLLETLIVSTILVGVLIFLYIQLVNVKESYDSSFQSNTVPGLYVSKEIAGYIFENDSVYNSLVNRLNNSQYGYVEISSTDINFKELFNGEALSPSMQTEVILFTDDNEKLDELKNALITKVFVSNNMGFNNFILKMNTKRTKYKRIFVEFKDKTYASVLVTNNIISTIYDATDIYYINENYTTNKKKPLNEVLDDIYKKVKNN